MAKYRKKPIVIEAFQYGCDLLPDWFFAKVTSGEIVMRTTIPDDAHIECSKDWDAIWCEIYTLEGIMRGNKGDFIIKGVKGEIYPCKPDIFMATYEQVEE